jgi:hypothetical protein
MKQREEGDAGEVSKPTVEVREQVDQEGIEVTG